MRNRSYHPRIEWLEARLAPALATREIPILIVPVGEPVQAVSLVQALASNPAFGGTTGGASAGTSTPLAVTAPTGAAGAAFAEGGFVAVGGVATGFSPFPFLRVLLVEKATPAEGNAQQPAAVTFLPVFVPTPNLLPATVFALLGTSPSAPPAQAGFPAFSSVRGFIVPANFPGTIINQVRSVLFRPEPSGTSAAGSVSGVVFRDANGNGEQDAGEAGLGGVRLTLERRQGDRYLWVADTVSDADGHYAFAGLVSGTYRVRAVTRTGQRVIKEVVLAPGGTATGQDVGLPPRQAEARPSRPGLEEAARDNVPADVVDWLFSDGPANQEPDLRQLAPPTAPGPRAAQAAALPPAEGSDPEADVVAAGEVLAFAAAVVAEFEGISDGELDRRPRWFPD